MYQRKIVQGFDRARPVLFPLDSDVCLLPFGVVNIALYVLITPSLLRASDSSEASISNKLGLLCLLLHAAAGCVVCVYVLHFSWILVAKIVTEF